MKNSEARKILEQEVLNTENDLDLPIDTILSFYNSVSDQGMFEKSMTIETWGQHSIPTVVLFSEEEGIKIRLDVSCASKYNGLEAGATWYITGHTSWSEGEKWFTFDRRGINDSFYAHNGEKDQFASNDINEAVVAEYEKIAEQREIVTVEIPDTNIHYAEKRIDELRKKLQAGGTIAITPSGMGVGYEFSSKSGRWTSPATAEQKKFWNVDRLFFSTLDCD